MPIPIIKIWGKLALTSGFPFFNVGIKIIGEEQRGIGEDGQGLKIAKTFDRRLERSGQFIEMVVSMLSILGASTLAQK